MTNILTALAFYVKYPGLHSFDTRDRGTVAAVRSLNKRGYLRIIGCQAEYTGKIFSKEDNSKTLATINHIDGFRTY